MLWLNSGGNMGFKEYCSNKGVSPICVCPTCESIYEDFISTIAVNYESRKLSEEMADISIDYHKKEIKRLTKQIELRDKLLSGFIEFEFGDGNLHGEIIGFKDVFGELLK
jgi:hypothetical protein